MIQTFTGLAGVNGDLHGPFVDSLSQFWTALQKHRTCCASGDAGCVQAWLDDAGEWRVAFMQNRGIVESQVWRKKKHLRDWLIHNLARIHA